MKQRPIANDTPKNRLYMYISRNFEKRSFAKKKQPTLALFLLAKYDMKNKNKAQYFRIDIA